jgi:diguanylate cyclase (GGDEF)-like protein
MSVETEPAKEDLDILVVEDSPTQAELLKYILEEQGYKVTLARDGKKAYASLNGYKPALIISDINMPGMNGYELCQRIKEDGLLGDIPVILLTSLSGVEDVMEALSCGADGFITKPYSADYILKHIKRILADNSSSSSKHANISVEVPFSGKGSLINADPQQMLSLLLSTYEAAMQRNAELNSLNEHLEELVDERTVKLTAEIMERERLQNELHALSLRDELTGLLNRRGFMTLAEQHWRLALRTHQKFALLFTDLDYLKRINDTLGHAQGDTALRDMAHALEKTFRESDIIARMGGDEFTVLFTDHTRDSIQTVLARLQENLNRVNETHNYILSASMGLAQFDPDHPASIADLLKQADAEMYAQKQQLRMGK